MLETLLVTPTQDQLSSIVQKHAIVTVKQRLQLLNAIDVYCIGAMNPNKPRWIEPGKKSRDSLTRQQLFRLYVCDSRMPVRFDPIDIIDVDQDEFFALSHCETIGVNRAS